MDSFIAHWTSPSNIALVKYWGKKPNQIPANSSLSFTLSHSLTSLKLEVNRTNKSTGVSLDFFFEDQSHEKFKHKILEFLKKQTQRFPWLESSHLTIHSFNTFPHSSGIASSASSMSALALCLWDIDGQVNRKPLGQADFFQKVSELAREASGSASRSVFPFMASWGEFNEVTSNLWANPVNKDFVHPLFHDFCDSIAIVDSGEKAVSSRAGHALMDTHPFNESRYQRAQENTRKLMDILSKGDLDLFIEVVEEEALMLHGLMMTSSPSVLLLKPESIDIIHKLRSFRNESKVPVCFTIDAGPNIHILYPKKFKDQVLSWMSEKLSSVKMIHDEVGSGPQNILTKALSQ